MNTDEIRETIRRLPASAQTSMWLEDQLFKALNEIDRLRLENQAIKTTTEESALYMMAVKRTKEACKKALKERCAFDEVAEAAIDEAEVT